MGFRRSRRLWVAGEVEGSWIEGSGSKIGGSKALGSWHDLGSGRAGEVEDWFVGSWCEASRSPVKSKLVGCRRWALSSSSLSLCVRPRSHSHSLSLSVFRKNDI